ncbi:MAG: hypothetical protein AAFQ82_22405, partial [Myxococcota bacterium]
TDRLILLEKDVYVENVSLGELKELLDGLALKLRAGLPRLRGRVTQANNDDVRLEMPDGDVLPAGTPLLVLEDDGVVGAAVLRNGPSGTSTAKRVSGAISTDATVVVK